MTFKGHKHTEEYKIKMSEILKERYKNKGHPWLGKKHPKEWKKMMSERLAGRIFSEETHEKMRQSHKGKAHGEEWKQNHSKAIKGRKQSEEWVNKRMDAIRGRFVGERSANWLGGISFEPYTTDWRESLKKAIRERDNYICQLCGQYGCHVHHIDYNKKNSDLTNLITLCKKCHGETNHNRELWKILLK